MKPENSEKSQSKQKLTSINKETKEEVKYTPIQKTPFTLMGNKDGVKILIGNQVCSKINFKNEEEAIHYINNKPYDLISVMAMILAEKIYEIKNEQTNKK